VTEKKWTADSSWIDHVLPLAVGACCGLITILQGGPFWTLPILSALTWCTWQLAFWLKAKLIVRVFLVMALSIVVLVVVYLTFRVDSAKLLQAISDVGIRVNAVSSGRDGVVVSIQPVSWGPERNRAMRAIFSAAHTHARSKKRVSIQWGDAMTATINMKDIDAFLAGKITYREILNRMDWSGTPEILPDDSTGRQANPPLLPGRTRANADSRFSHFPHPSN
jgi:hypothetical protein